MLVRSYQQLIVRTKCLESIHQRREWTDMVRLVSYGLLVTPAFILVTCTSAIRLT
jgi:hypothetical protein